MAFRLAVVLAALATASAAQAEPGTCYFAVDGAVLIHGTCDLERQPSGDFRFASPDGDWFGDVILWSETEAGGAWNGARGSDHAQNVMGPLAAGPEGCWSNEAITICAQ